MSEMRDVVEAVKASELNGKVKIMVGGAPITQAFCDSHRRRLLYPGRCKRGRGSSGFLRAEVSQTDRFCGLRPGARGKRTTAQDK